MSIERNPNSNFLYLSHDLIQTIMGHADSRTSRTLGLTCRFLRLYWESALPQLLCPHFIPRGLHNRYSRIDEDQARILYKRYLFSPSNITESIELSGHIDAIRCLTTLPDGRIVSGSSDQTLRVWNPETGASQELRGHRGLISCLTSLPDERIVSGSYDQTLRVWNLETGASQVLRGHTRMSFCLTTLTLFNARMIFCLTTLSDGRIVSGSEDHTLRVWDPLPHLSPPQALGIFSNTQQDESP